MCVRFNFPTVIVYQQVNVHVLNVRLASNTYLIQYVFSLTQLDLIS